MIQITNTFKVSAPEVSLTDFKQDMPYPSAETAREDSQPEGLIEGLRITSIVRASDSRGTLSELFTTRDNHSRATDAIVHIYQVTAIPDSRRAWVYHRWQNDRLAYTNGHFRVVLYDLRPDSSTFGLLQVLHVGIDQPVLLEIPPLVVHGVQNIGSETATFINMPTRPWCPADPDKMRLPEKDSRIPFNFDV